MNQHKEKYKSVCGGRMNQHRGQYKLKRDRERER